LAGSAAMPYDDRGPGYRADALAGLRRVRASARLVAWRFLPTMPLARNSTERFAARPEDAASPKPQLRQGEPIE